MESFARFPSLSKFWKMAYSLQNLRLPFGRPRLIRNGNFWAQKRGDHDSASNWSFKFVISTSFAPPKVRKTGKWAKGQPMRMLQDFQSSQKCQNENLRVRSGGKAKIRNLSSWNFRNWANFDPPKTRRWFWVFSLTFQNLQNTPNPSKPAPTLLVPQIWKKNWKF